MRKQNQPKMKAGVAEYVRYHGGDQASAASSCVIGADQIKLANVNGVAD